MGEDEQLAAEHHQQFLANLKKSHKAPFVVGLFYRYRGRHASYPPIKTARHRKEAGNFRDDYDLQLLYQGKTTGVSVKHLWKHQFHGPPGTPGGWYLDKVVVGKVTDVDEMLPYVQQWCICSSDLSTMAVHYKRDQPRWFIEDMQDNVTGEWHPHYFIAPQFCEFYTLEPPEEPNDESLIPMPWRRPP